MEHLLDLITVFSIVLIVFVLLTLRRERIRVEYSVSWLAAGLLLLVLSRSTAALGWVTALLRLQNPVLALLTLVSITFLVVFFRFSVVLSQLKDSNVATVQRVAILEYQLRELNEKKQANQSRS
jgi:heme A synthase